MHSATMKRIAATAAIAALLSGCSSPSKPDAAMSSRHPADIAAEQPKLYSEAEREAKGLPPGPGITLPPTTTTTSTTTAPPNRPPGGGATAATAPPPPSSGTAIAEPDVFERRTKAEGTRVASGSNAQVEWRLYAWRPSDKAETCLGFYTATHQFEGGNAGGSVMCKQRPPLDASTSRSSEGTFVYGLTAPGVVRVRAEHADGSSETFDTVAPQGFDVRFYAGEVAPTPLKRLVGLDANGKAVAEKDMSAYGQPVSG